MVWKFFQALGRPKQRFLDLDEVETRHQLAGLRDLIIERPSGPPTIAASNLGAENSRSVLKRYAQADAAFRMSLEMCCAISWKVFLANFKTPGKFADQPKEVQSEYVRKLVQFGNQEIETGVKEAGFANHLLAAYLSAIVAGDDALERELAASLEAITRRGWAYI